MNIAVGGTWYVSFKKKKRNDFSFVLLGVDHKVSMKASSLVKWKLIGYISISDVKYQSIKFAI
jgi:hypothetical protein